MLSLPLHAHPDAYVELLMPSPQNVTASGEKVFEGEVKVQ